MNHILSSNRFSILLTNHSKKLQSPKCGSWTTYDVVPEPHDVVHEPHGVVHEPHVVVPEPQCVVHEPHVWFMNHTYRCQILGGKRILQNMKWIFYPELSACVVFVKRSKNIRNGFLEHFYWKAVLQFFSQLFFSSKKKCFQKCFFQKSKIENFQRENIFSYIKFYIGKNFFPLKIFDFRFLKKKYFLKYHFLSKKKVEKKKTETSFRCKILSGIDFWWFWNVLSTPSTT